MTTSAILETHPPSDVFKSLEGVCHDSGLGALAGRLGELRPWLEGDLVEVEQQLRTMLFGETPAEQSARHLIQMPGKRLRPLCVALAAHMGAGFGREARELAVAVELVHNATLLHDDVVDLGDLRRGALERASEAGELGLAPIERRVARAMEDGRVEAGAREFAERLIREAIDELSELSDCPAKTALASVAIATLGRRK